MSNRTEERTHGINRFIHPLHCTITGVPLGHLDLVVSAGHMPYLSHWDKQICYHPFFSLNQQSLLHYMRDEWNRLAKGVADESISDKESTNLRVGFVAILCSLGGIKQDSGVTLLPDLRIVHSNLESLTALAYWQNYLDSKRFSFPDYHFSRINGNADLSGIHDYLEACWERKKEYESGMSDIQEKEKARIAEKAILAIRNTFLKPPSKKLLWTWIKGNLPSKWHPDAEGWLATLFLGSVAASLEFEEEDIDLMEEIIVASCPIGNSVMFAVRERIAEIKKYWKEHNDTFIIEEDSLELMEQLRTEQEDIPAPERKNFKNDAMFYVARAKWDIAHPHPKDPKVNKEIESAREKLSYKAGEL